MIHGGYSCMKLVQAFVEARVCATLILLLSTCTGFVFLEIEFGLQGFAVMLGALRRK